MLRALQTKVLSDKVSKLFDSLAATAMPTAQPILVDAKRPSENGSRYANSAYTPPRRRRYRRSPLIATTGTIRTSWF